uniref:Uncharacterized protein n=1 Tax=Setaria viridis TaxID=4556 RepID=A0A4U6VRB1_SETVI|nr:hypothetical protein SEVIR_2G164933v2 [Setaria viridis]
MVSHAPALLVPDQQLKWNLAFATAVRSPVRCPLFPHQRRSREVPDPGCSASALPFSCRAIPLAPGRPQVHDRACGLFLYVMIGDTLDKPREGRDDGTEPEDGVWWSYPEDGRTKQVLRWEMLAKRVSSNKH